MIPSLISMLVIIGVITTLVVGVRKAKKQETQTQDYWKGKLAEAEAQEKEFKVYAEKVLSDSKTNKVSKEPKKRAPKMKAEKLETEKKKQTKKSKSNKKQKVYEVH